MVLQAELDHPQQLLPSFWWQVPASGAHLDGADATSHPFEEQLLLPSPSQSTSSSSLLVLSRQLPQALQRSSDMNDTDVNMDTGYVLTHAFTPQVRVALT